jgi:hypothetical protein
LGLLRRNWILIVVILGAVALVVAFRLNQKPESEYFTAKVEQGDIWQVIEATGTINPVTLVQVGSQVSGMISKLYVDFNSKVTQGQIIAEIDPKPSRSRRTSPRCTVRSPGVGNIPMLIESQSAGHLEAAGLRINLRQKDLGKGLRSKQNEPLAISGNAEPADSTHTPGELDRPTFRLSPLLIDANRPDPKIAEFAAWIAPVGI